MKITNTNITIQADGKHSAYATVNLSDVSTNEAYSLQQLTGDEIIVSKAYQIPTITGPITETVTGCSYDMDSNICYYDYYSIKPKAKQNSLEINNIDYNEEVGLVVVVFKDGTVIRKKACKGDTFDLNVGVALCIAEKLYGSSTQYHKAVEKLKKTVDDKKTRKAAAKAKKAQINGAK